MHKEYILLNCFRKAKRGFTAGFHVPLMKKLVFKRRLEVLKFRAEFTLSWSDLHTQLVRQQKKTCIRYLFQMTLGVKKGSELAD